MSLKNKIIYLLLLLFLGWQTAAQAGTPLRVSLLLGDVDTRAAVLAVKGLQHNSNLQDVSFSTYPSATIAHTDRSALRQSQVVVIQLMGSQLFSAVQDDLKSVIAAGGKVYAVYPASTEVSQDKLAIGLLQDDTALAYHRAGGQENIANMLLYLVQKTRGLANSVAPPKPLPESGIYHVGDGKLYTDFATYQTECSDCIAGNPWVGIHFGRSNLTSGQMTTVDSIAQQLKVKGFNVLPVFGYPPEAPLKQYLLTPEGNSRVDALIGLTLKIGVTPDTTGKVLQQLGVPVINAISLASQSQTEWEQSKVGLDTTERSWQIAGAELGGLIAPTVVASKERLIDPDTHLSYLEERPIPERIARLVTRVENWVKLRTLDNKDKRVAIVYYNYPPGKENIGASYLNVLPGSLWQMLERLKQDGYTLTNAPSSKEALFEDIHNFGTNINKPDMQAVAKLARSGKAALLPVATYRKWFNELAEPLRAKIIKDWGEPENSQIMVWRDERKEPYFVFPQIQYGNILFTPQPTRGWEQDVQKIYHDVTLAPHHQYVAFYLWLQHEYQAHAVTHVGTHGTIEWLSGKEVGASRDDPAEALIGALPHLYLYIMDDVGEALQAKRRSMAVIINHLTPPFDKAGMHGDLKELAGRINDYNVAKEKSASAAANQLKELNRQAEKIGILNDLELVKIETEDQIEHVEHYIKEIAEKAAPFGLHTFGVAPSKELRQKTAAAMASMDKKLQGKQKQQFIEKVDADILTSAQAELDAFSSGLKGGFIPPGAGADPIRNPDALPTGKDMFGFDPTRMPSPTAYQQGLALANGLVNDYKQRHSDYPDKLTFNLWGVESSRHEGVMEAQIFALLGVKPIWDARGRVTGVSPIPRQVLGHPRIDVTIIPSGLYRDLFSNLIKLLDNAVVLAKQQDEADNFLRTHVAATKAKLIAQGIDAEQAEKLATVRLFSVPSGAYGTNLDRIIPLSNTWQNDKQLADVYFMRMSHMYGQGLWGDKAAQTPQLAVDLLKQALSGSKMVVHSRSSNVYASLDGDDFFQYLGGTAMAIRAVDGKTPETYVADLSDPNAPKQESLAKYMGREMRSRYLNPEWIKAMLKEGYAGARFVNMVVENLWGWQVTVPEVVDAAKWQEIYETYVEDKHHLEVKEKFREAKNMLAYQAMVDRMLVAVKKGYWKAAPDVVKRLEQENQQAIKEAGVACTRDTCSDPKLADQQAAPGQQSTPNQAAAKPTQAAPSQASKPPAVATNSQTAQAVKGYEMQEKKLTVSNTQTKANQASNLTTLLLLGLFGLLFGGGFLWQARQYPSKLT